MTKRQIRLKEYRPNSDHWVTPSSEYLERTDGSLGVGPFRCRSDKNGFIITGNFVPESAEPLVFLGGSFVESIYSAESNRFVSSVERSLNDASCFTRCLNGGYSGSTTLQLLNVLTNKIYPLVGPGGTVVLFGPHSDRDYLYRQGTYWSDTERGATIVPPPETGHPDIPRGRAAAVLVFRLLAMTAGHLGLRLVLATSPYRTGDYGSDPLFARNYHGRQDWFRAGMLRRGHFTSVVRETAAEFGLPLIDAEAFIGGNPAYFYDELHLNEGGQRHLADFVARELQGIMTPVSHALGHL